MNNNYVKLLNNLQNLKLEQIKDNLDKYLDLINEGKKDIVDSLYELTALEIDLKKEKAMSACVRVANFPFLKTLDEFDFSFQPSINKEKMLDFRNLRFIENNENILFVGSPGVGKTHLATSIGIEAGQMPVENVHLVQLHDVYIPLDLPDTEKMPAYIKVHAPIPEPREIAYAAAWDIRIHLPQRLAGIIQPMQPRRLHRDAVFTYIYGIMSLWKIPVIQEQYGSLFPILDS